MKYWLLAGLTLLLNIENRLKKLPKDAFLTEEEVIQALKTLNESK
jgi:hypothetical protein